MLAKRNFVLACALLILICSCALANNGEGLVQTQEQNQGQTNEQWQENIFKEGGDRWIQSLQMPYHLWQGPDPNDPEFSWQGLGAVLEGIWTEKKVNHFLNNTGVCFANSKNWPFRFLRPFLVKTPPSRFPHTNEIVLRSNLTLDSNDLRAYEMIGVVRVIAKNYNLTMEETLACALQAAMDVGGDLAVLPKGGCGFSTCLRGKSFGLPFGVTSFSGNVVSAGSIAWGEAEIGKVYYSGAVVIVFRKKASEAVQKSSTPPAP